MEGSSSSAEEQTVDVVVVQAGHLEVCQHRFWLLRSQIESYLAAYQGGRWSPAEDERLWSILPEGGQPFPWASLPERREFHEQCLAHQWECALHEAEHPNGVTMPHGVPVPYDGRLVEVLRAAILSEHIAYCETIIREHRDASSGHGLCWEHAERLGLAYYAAKGFEQRFERPNIEECMTRCMRYRGRIEQALAARRPLPVVEGDSAQET